MYTVYSRFPMETFDKLLVASKKLKHDMHATGSYVLYIYFVCYRVYSTVSTHYSYSWLSCDVFRMSFLDFCICILSTWFCEGPATLIVYHTDILTVFNWCERSYCLTLCTSVYVIVSSSYVRHYSFYMIYRNRASTVLSCVSLIFLCMGTS